MATNAKSDGIGGAALLVLVVGVAAYWIGRAGGYYSVGIGALVLAVSCFTAYANANRASREGALIVAALAGVLLAGGVVAGRERSALATEQAANAQRDKKALAASEALKVQRLADLERLPVATDAAQVQSACAALKDWWATVPATEKTRCADADKAVAVVGWPQALQVARGKLKDAAHESAEAEKQIKSGDSWQAVRHADAVISQLQEVDATLATVRGTEIEPSSDWRQLRRDVDARLKSATALAERAKKQRRLDDGAPDRRAYASKLEQKLLNNGSDAHVRAAGPGARTLYVQYFGCGRVFLNSWFVEAESDKNVVDAFNSGLDGKEVPNRNGAEARGAGFEKVICNDDYGGGASLSL